MGPGSAADLVASTCRMQKDRIHKSAHNVGVCGLKYVNIEWMRWCCSVRGLGWGGGGVERSITNLTPRNTFSSLSCCCRSGRILLFFRPSSHSRNSASHWPRDAILVLGWEMLAVALPSVL